MIKIETLALVLAMIIAASGCRPNAGGGTEGGGVPLMQFLGGEHSALANSKTLPVSLDYVSYVESDAGDGGRCTDEATIRAVLDALSEVRVYEKLGDSGTAYYMETVQFIFRTKNDKQIMFGFDKGDLIYKKQQRYRVEGYYAVLDALFPPEPTPVLQPGEFPPDPSPPVAYIDEWEVRLMESGNALGNTANGAWAVKSFYSDCDIIATERGIYRVLIDGSAELILPRRASHLNICNNETLLYIGYGADGAADGIYALDLYHPDKRKPYAEQKIWSGVPTKMQMSRNGFELDSVDASLYILTENMLLRADISELGELTAITPFCWGEDVNRRTDATGLAHSGVLDFAVMPTGEVCVKLEFSGVRRQEMTYKFSADGKIAKRMPEFDDLAMSGMFFTQDCYMIFHYGGNDYGGGDAEHGVYAYRDGSGGYITLTENATFNIWELDGQLDRRRLIVADERGVRTVQFSDNGIGETATLFEGSAAYPNTAWSRVYFMVDDGGEVAYYRAAADGSVPATRIELGG